MRPAAFFVVRLRPPLAVVHRFSLPNKTGDVSPELEWLSAQGGPDGSGPGGESKGLSHMSQAAPAPHQVTVEVGGRTLTLETGKIAKQANGAVLARYGDTVVLVTAC